jgi:hypothetical protein
MPMVIINNYVDEGIVIWRNNKYLGSLSKTNVSLLSRLCLRTSRTIDPYANANARKYAINEWPRN